MLRGRAKAETVIVAALGLKHPMGAGINDKHRACLCPSIRTNENSLFGARSFSPSVKQPFLLPWSDVSGAMIIESIIMPERRALRYNRASGLD